MARKLEQVSTRTSLGLGQRDGEGGCGGIGTCIISNLVTHLGLCRGWSRFSRTQHRLVYLVKPERNMGIAVFNVERTDDGRFDVTVISQYPLSARPLNKPRVAREAYVAPGTNKAEPTDHADIHVYCLRRSKSLHLPTPSRFDSQSAMHFLIYLGPTTENAPYGLIFSPAPW